MIAIPCKVIKFYRPFMFLLILASGLATGNLPIGHTCKNASISHDCGDNLICNPEGKCAYCEYDNQCLQHFYCKSKAGYEGGMICNYEPLTHVWDKQLSIGMATIFVAGIFVSGAGIGGGGLFVPILMLIVGFPSYYAIPTSKALIFGGSLAVTIFNIPKRHPFYDRPMINYNVAAMIEPISWLGTVIGVIFNQILPPWFLYLLQFILLTFTAWSTFKKGLSDQKKAKEIGLESELITKGTYDGPTYSKFLLLLLFVTWVVFLAVSFLRGGDGADSAIGIEFCSTWYWILTFGPFPIYLAITWWMVSIARHYPVLGHNAKCTNKDVFVLMMSGFVAGMAAGFLGIGGGMVKGPMMLNLDIEPEEMAATSTLMILMTSSATSIQYIALGTLPIIEFIIFVAIGFVSFLIGIIFLRWLVKKMGNRSIFLYFLAGIIAISAVLMSIVGVQIVIANIKEHVPMGLVPFCR